MRKQIIVQPDPQEATNEIIKRKMGRPEKLLDAEKLKTVIAMASYGIPQSHIARHMEMSVNTLRKRYRKELRHAAYDANNAVLESLFTMATTRHNVSAAIFWAKTRCAMRPGGAPHENAPGVIRQKQQPAKPEKPEPSYEDTHYDETNEDGSPKLGYEFSVYNNDGEPNANY